jgi:hypothetical protein
MNDWDKLVGILRREMPGHADAIVAFLEDADTAKRMATLNDHNVPPLAEVSRCLATLAARPTDTAKRTMGRLVKRVMERGGYVPIRSARVPPPSFFATGALYGPEPSA